MMMHDVEWNVRGEGYPCNTTCNMMMHDVEWNVRGENRVKARRYVAAIDDVA